MTYPKKLKERAVQLANEGFSAEAIAEKFSREAEKNEHDYIPNPRTIRNWLKSELKAISNKKNAPLLIKAREKHLSEIDSMLEGLIKELEDLSENYRIYLTFYTMERDFRFAHLLQHCPSVNERYEIVKQQRQKYIESKDRLIRKITRDIPQVSNDSFIEVAAHYSIRAREEDIDDDDEAYSIIPEYSTNVSARLWGFNDRGHQIVIAEGNEEFLLKCEQTHQHFVNKYKDSNQARDTHNRLLAYVQAVGEFEEAVKLSLFSKEYAKYTCALCIKLI